MTDYQARAMVAEGTDRDTLWGRHVAEHPQFAEYPSKTDRIIPIARLKPQWPEAAATSSR